MIHAHTVDRIRARAALRWGYDPELLGQPVGACNTRSHESVRLHRVLWACMVAARRLGVPRKAVEHLFGASESTVSRATRKASPRDVLLLTGGAL